jgi:hypothetical protein
LSVTLGTDTASSAFLDRHVDMSVAMVIGYCTTSPRTGPVRTVRK